MKPSKAVVFAYSRMAFKKSKSKGKAKGKGKKVKKSSKGRKDDWSFEGGASIVDPGTIEKSIQHENGRNGSTRVYRHTQEKDEKFRRADRKQDDRKRKRDFVNKMSKKVKFSDILNNEDPLTSEPHSEDENNDGEYATAPRPLPRRNPLPLAQRLQIIVAGSLRKKGLTEEALLAQEEDSNDHERFSREQILDGEHSELEVGVKLFDAETTAADTREQGGVPRVGQEISEEEGMRLIGEDSNADDKSDPGAEEGEDGGGSDSDSSAEASATSRAGRKRPNNASSTVKKQRDIQDNFSIFFNSNNLKDEFASNAGAGGDAIVGARRNMQLVSNIDGTADQLYAYISSMLYFPLKQAALKPPAVAPKKQVQRRGIALPAANAAALQEEEQRATTAITPWRTLQDVPKLHKMWGAKDSASSSSFASATSATAGSFPRFGPLSAQLLPCWNTFADAFVEGRDHHCDQDLLLGVVAHVVTHAVKAR